MSSAHDAPSGSRWLTAALAPLALSWITCATTLTAVTLPRAGAIALVSTATFTFSLAWLMRAPRGWHVGAAATFALSLAALDLGLATRIPYGTPWRSSAWVLAPLASVGIAAWLARRLAVPHRFARASRAVAFAIVCITALLGALYLVEIANCLRQSRGDPERRVGTAIVLGFGLLEGGVASPVFVARIARGVALYRTGRCARVLFTGGVGTHGPAESVVAVAVAREMGLPEEATLHEERSHTTRENMIEAARVLRAQGLPTGPVAVVSDTFHLARSRRLARDAGLDPVMVAAVTPAWTNPRRATWWVLRESALLVLDDVLRLGRVRR